MYPNRITFYSSRIHRLASPPSTTSDDDSLGHVRLAGREESARGLHDAGAKVFDIQARCMRPCEDVVPAVRSPFLCFSSSVVGNHPAYYSFCRVGQCASQRTGGSLSGRGCPPSGTEMYAVGRCLPSVSSQSSLSRQRGCSRHTLPDRQATDLEARERVCHTPRVVALPRFLSESILMLPWLFIVDRCFIAMAGISGPKLVKHLV